ncbi:biotin-dependent carboxyltransferase family protein [[Pseudomonas] carboxydohydrogena]|uniref:Biotin-dependent carboxyltransferase family protein n=1 Tax=Afipia carboxydohydrogena TaxID=290 RepID=A0ABY8BMP5_AFICR|nr:biotin-dependent carboxyltransferase family protein [[Pseudomonas] carboxydohydrogena]WEF50189.1 biotin-dependent carboxyltransferase family protein [[Pseudomonas] carboxydohydrogena]
MSVLEVIAAGPLTSVQDIGRFGAQRYGLTPSGAMDRLSLAAANALVGHPLSAPTIEIGPLKAVFAARGGPLCVALTGALRFARTDDKPCPLYRSFLLRDGDTLTLDAARKGMFSYLAVAGDLKGEAMFGSFSVNARAGLGSPYPRPLQGGDRLTFDNAISLPDRTMSPPVFGEGAIRVVPGPQYDEFGASSKVFFNSPWQISPTSDRMGYRLEGSPLTHAGNFNIVSDGTVDGSIQVTGNGQPIVLMRDRGTTGGYPKIATIISADLGRFAQTRPRHTFRFAEIDVAAAQQEARAFHALLQSLPDRIRNST